MKRILALFFAALFLFSGCAAVPSQSEATFDASPTAAPTPPVTAEPTPSPSPTPVPTAEPVLHAEAASSGVSPYILPGQDDTTVRVCWSGDYCSEGMCVLYGPAGADDALPAEPLIAEATSSWMDILCYSEDKMQYAAELTVEPGTRYAYAVVKTGEAAGSVYHFRTGSADRLCTVAVSDTHLFSDKPNTYHPALLEATLESALRTETDEGKPLDMILHAGDILDYPEYSLDMLFDGVPMLRSFVLAPVSGNHDSLYAVRHRFPMAGQDERNGDYWFVRSGVLFIGVQIGDRYYPNHTEFLRSAAENAPEHSWTVVLIHYAVRSNGVHARDAAVVGFRTALEPVMEEIDVDLVISGHDHEYNRTALLGGDEPDTDASDILYKQPGERLYITMPTGAGLKYYEEGCSVDFPFTAEGLEHEVGYVFFDFTPEEITLSARSADTGEEIDAVTLRRGALSDTEEE